VLPFYSIERLFFILSFMFGYWLLVVFFFPFFFEKRIPIDPIAAVPQTKGSKEKEPIAKTDPHIAPPVGIVAISAINNTDPIPITLAFELLILLDIKMPPLN
jgi:hypothetical protein